MTLRRLALVTTLLAALSGCGTPPKATTTYAGPTFDLAATTGPALAVRVRFLDQAGADATVPHDGFDDLLADALTQHGVHIVDNPAAPMLDIVVQAHGKANGWMERVAPPLPVPYRASAKIMLDYALTATLRHPGEPAGPRVSIPVKTWRTIDVTTLDPSWLHDLQHALQSDYDQSKIDAIGKLLRQLQDAPEARAPAFFG